MKLFVLFMGFCILYMTAIPCNDQTVSETTETSSVFAAKDNPHQHTNDHCTPFCACSCCATHVITQSPYHLQAAKKSFEGKPVPYYVSPFSSDNSFIIWQPPRLIS